MLLSAAIAGSSDDGRRGEARRDEPRDGGGVGMRLCEFELGCELGCELGRELGRERSCTGDEAAARARRWCSWGRSCRKAEGATAGGSAASSDEAVEVLAQRAVAGARVAAASAAGS